MDAHSMDRRWIARPIFVSSTFQDMHAERDYLRAHVFPELAQRLRKRFHTLEVVDLRQGIESASIDEQASRDLAVLQVCLREIRRSRPYFIGLLGDRYGWIPPRQRVEAAMSEVGFDTPLTDVSVTELEILYGATAAADVPVRAWLYLREPLPYHDMPNHIADLYQGRDSREADALAARLTDLKTRLRTDPRTRDHVRTYKASWSHETTRIDQESLRAWGEQILEDLWRDLDRETADYLTRTPVTWQEVDRELLESFVDERVYDFVGRDDCVRRLVDHSSNERSGSPWCVYVAAPSGSGKSSLFAKLCRELRGHGSTVVLAHAAGICAGADSIDRMLRRWVFELARINQGRQDDGEKAVESRRNGAGTADSDEMTTPEEVQAEFARLLHRVSQDRRVVILVDALDRFSDVGLATSLTWMPSLLAGATRVVVTSVAEFTGSHIHENVDTMCVPPLTPEEGRLFAERVYHRYHRQPNQDAVSTILEKKDATGKPAAGSPLWLRLALDFLNLMEGDDFLRAEQEFVSLPPHARMHALMIQEASRFPAEVPQAFAWLLEKAERHFGRDTTRSLLDVVALSRDGWRQTDLATLVPRLSGAPWNDLAFAEIRRYLGSHLVQRGGGSHWNFLHELFRKAVLERNLPTEDQRRRVHRKVVDYLTQLPPDDEVRRREMMHHLLCTGDSTLCARYLTSMDDDDSGLPYATQSLADYCARSSIVHLWAGDGDQLKEDGPDRLEQLRSLLRGVPELFGDVDHDPTFSVSPGTKMRLITSMSLRCVAGMVDAEGIGPAEIVRVAHILQNRVRLPSGGIRVILQTCRRALEKVLSQNPENAGAKAELFRNMYFFGDVLLEQGSTEEAWRILSAAYDFVVNSQGETSRVSLEEDVAKCLIAMASAEMRMGRRPQAAAHQEEAIDRLDRLRREGRLSKGGFALAIDSAFERFDELLELGECAAAGQFYQRAVALLDAERGQGSLRLEQAARRTSKHGNLLMCQRDHEGALAEYRRSLEIAEELLEHDPLGLQAMHRVAISSGKVANALMALGRHEEAIAGSRRCVELSEKAIDFDRASLALQEANAVDHGRLGQILLQAGRLEEALDETTKAIDTLAAWAETDPRNVKIRQRLANACRQSVEIHEKRGTLDVAAKPYATGLLARMEIARLAAAGNEAIQQLVEEALSSTRDPAIACNDALTLELLQAAASLARGLRLLESEVQFQFDIGLCRQRIAGVLEKLGQWREALDAYDLAREGLSQLAQRTRQRVPIETYLLVSKSRLDLCRRRYEAGEEQPLDAETLCSEYVAYGDSWRSLGDADKAIPCFEAALSVGDSEVGKGDGGTQFARSSSVALERLGDCMVMKEDFAAAAHCYSRCIEVRVGIDRSRDDADSKMILGAAYDRLGAALANCGRNDESMKCHLHAVSLLQEAIRKGGYLFSGMESLYMLAVALVNLGTRNREVDPSAMVDSLVAAHLIVEFLESKGVRIEPDLKSQVNYAKVLFDRGIVPPQALEEGRARLHAALGIPEEDHGRRGVEP